MQENNGAIVNSVEDALNDDCGSWFRPISWIDTPQNRRQTKTRSERLDRAIEMTAGRTEGERRLIGERLNLPRCAL